MKVIKHYEFAIAEQDEMLQIWGEYLERSKKNPEKYPKYIAGPFIVAQTSEMMKGVSIMEIDNDEQLVNYILDLSPPLKAKFELLYDSSSYIPIYMERKNKS
ncbi:hypothetical protein GF319_07675 [Candidatus Bathyarchaeota archaeon]|nr:hypothetical protein [Candidatus Bathyarchaeota archaeon]